MTVRIFGYLRKALAADVLQLEAATVREVLAALGSRLDLGDAAARRMLERAVVLVNGRHVASAQGLDTGLRPDDEVTILQQIAGG